MLKSGDVVSTRNIRAYFTSQEIRGWCEYKAEKGKNMVFIYLGQEPKNGSKNIKPDEILRILGWALKSKAEAKE